MSKIEIFVKGENGSTENTTTSSPLNKEPNTAQQASERIDTKNNLATKNKQGAQGMAIASMIASKSLNYATSNVGKWTGNSRNQDTVNAIQQVVGIGAAAYINPYLALAVAAIQVGTTAIDAAYDNYAEGLKSNIRKLRAGYNSNDSIIGGRK